MVAKPLKALLTGAMAALLACAAIAQEPARDPATRILGTIQSLEGQVLVVRTDDGQSVAVTLPTQVRVAANTRSTLADIKPGDFVGSAALKGSDGRLHAQEVRIFPESLRGSGEGHRPMGATPGRSMTNATVTAVAGAAPERSMTNATVSAVAAGSQGRVLKLKYAGGEAEIEVAPDVPIVTIVPGDASLLQPGVSVSIAGVKTGTGILARSVTVEGVRPRR